MAPRLVLACLLATSGCASYGFNYLDPALPRCAEALGSSRPVVVAPETFQLVSFNIKFGEEPEKAMRALERNGLQNADVFLLQEMDLPSTRTIARVLELNYVYYPIALHPKSGRQFGLALLSPWPSATIERSSCHASTRATTFERRRSPLTFGSKERPSASSMPIFNRA